MVSGGRGSTGSNDIQIGPMSPTSKWDAVGYGEHLFVSTVNMHVLLSINGPINIPIWLAVK